MIFKYIYYIYIYSNMYLVQVIQQICVGMPSGTPWPRELLFLTKPSRWQAKPCQEYGSCGGACCKSGRSCRMRGFLGFSSLLQFKKRMNKRILCYSYAMDLFGLVSFWRRMQQTRLGHSSPVRWWPKWNSRWGCRWDGPLSCEFIRSSVISFEDMDNLAGKMRGILWNIYIYLWFGYICTGRLCNVYIYMWYIGSSWIF